MAAGASIRALVRRSWVAPPWFALAAALARSGCLLSVCLLSACLTPLRFGAGTIERVADTGGIPTYNASGNMSSRQVPEEKAAEVMKAACPDGNPRLIDGHIMWFQGSPSRIWSATFTCDHAIDIPND